MHSALTHSLSEDKVQRSNSECNAVVRAYIECMRYAITKSIQDNDQLDLVEDLLENQVRRLDDVLDYAGL